MKLNRRILLSVTASVVLTLLIGGGWMTLHVQIQELRNQVSYLTNTVSKQMDAQQTSIKKIGINQNILFNRLNENREALQLPLAQSIPLEDTRKDKNNNKKEKDAEKTEGTDAIKLFFNGIHFFDQHYRREKLSKKFIQFIKAPDFAKKIDSLGLKYYEMDSHTYLLQFKGNKVFELNSLYMNENPHVKISSILQHEKIIQLNSGTSSIEQSAAFLENELELIISHYKDFLSKAEFCKDTLNSSFFLEILSSKKLKVVGPDSISDHPMESALWKISPPQSLHTKQSVFLRFGVNFQSKRYFIEEEYFTNGTDFKTALSTQLAKIDSRTPQQKDVARALEQVKEISQKKSFNKFLSQNDLYMNSEAREDGDYYYFDIYRVSDNSRYGSFAVLKKHGKIYLTDYEDIVITALDTVSTSLKSAMHVSKENHEVETLPPASSISKAGSSKESIILLCGTHEKNADTMIIARLSEKKGIRLISIPRDIYYKNRKISSYYRLYGMDKLRLVLEELAGIEFDGHIEVDMYAFIDVVNILNGINIKLENALIDPTYKVRENGEWKTLYYSAGNHHLSGIEALRIARSRHTSDDFERSYRQQMIIKALFNKLNKMHAGKLEEVYKLIRVLYKYVDTDFSAYELAQFYIKYHNASLEPRKSLSTDNVLYTTYSNYYLSGLTKEEVDEDFYKGAWILLPRQNNWELIPRYVHQQLYH